MTSDNNLKASRPKRTFEDDLSSGKGEMGEFFKTAIIAVLLALTIRTFLYEPFNIPSGSMMPTLEIGDYLFVSKPAYGYSRYSFPFGIANFEGRHFGAQPLRGDVVVFKLPSNTTVDYIKRIVGMPGDKIQVINGRLHVNGEATLREPVGMKRVNKGFGPDVSMMEYIETLPGGAMHRIYEESDDGGLDNTPVYTVPDNHYFVMGDNRDNSQDSRVQELVGFVPLENIVGRADFLFFSVEEDASLFKPWRWPVDIRYSRIFDSINPVRPAESQE